MTEIQLTLTPQRRLDEIRGYLGFRLLPFAAKSPRVLEDLKFLEEYGHHLELACLRARLS